MKVLVLAYGDGGAASTLYRYRVGEDLWRSKGHELKIVPVGGLSGDFWREIQRYDAVINQKALLGGKFLRRLRATGIPLFFDFDDAIWTRPKKPYSWWTQWKVNSRIRAWFCNVRGVMAANQYLADFARRFTQSVRIVPMALDLDIWRPVPKSRDRFRIGWAGSPANLWHLERLREPLGKLVRKRKDIEVAVFSGQRPCFDFPHEYVPYFQGAEREFVAGLDVGLLPLDSEPYSLGKSPIKALQYMSCGVAVVGNAAGASAELLDGRNGVVIRSESEWLPALEGILSVPERLREVGMAGRRFVEERHDLRKVTEQQIERLVDQLSDQRARTSLGPADVRGLRSE